MRLGVREFLPIPFDDELAVAVARLSTRMPAHQTRRESEKKGRLICVLSSKGGSGSTLIATNLAVSLARHAKKKTTLLDLNLQLGDVSLFLGLKPRATISDLAKSIDRLDAVLLLELMTKHASGVQVLAAPKLLEEAGLLSHAHLNKIYALVKAVFEVAVVDLPVAFDEQMLATLQHADEILLVTMLNIPSLRNTRRYLEIFWRLGVPKERVRVVVNRHDRRAEGALSVKDAEQALRHPIFFLIPNNYDDVLSAINQGIPLADVVPNDPIVKAFHELAGQLCRPHRASGIHNGAAERNGGQRAGGFLEKLFKRVGAD
jgi:pilus assembly protein CpaE